ncbi:MAG: twin-arginine translocase TatA/TatE family subunit [Flavobacteriaceae bacterium]|jgi:sec-independent protein translocase protein TatA|nr:twin-arginine translocase TatA/TatE family subunit [Flavobacteriaceae bacterium]MCH1454535.1 twin-arginine translocase TatA/TatE family subunit [Flavobacteriaceae bacterium]MDG1290812.1 twin-arginine translocase TatA/TatE family subunit [Flavobacteriaceae bacterium]MDG1966391.1 twin-arginine translocase TatA/TatE family subunit [Flavobacteriaceae bacterium]|tara:strand:- start:274 stop:546 length:273 start_codon:yes stop_codon:yes gene_type:complete
MFLFISGAEIVFIFFIVLLIFGADKIPSIAKTLAKGVTQVRNATNEIKTEIQKSVDTKNPTAGVGKELKSQVDKVKEDFEELTDSIKRDL